MTQRLLLISHNPPPLTDRVQDWAKDRYVTVDARYPCLGDPLPDTTDGYLGSVVYGGRFNADAVDEHPFLRDEYRWIDQSLTTNLPILGICLGAQMIARHLGGGAGPLPDNRIEFGFYDVRPVAGAETFLPAPMTVTQAHFHGIHLPSDAERLAESDLFPNQAFRYGPKVLGVQFHPEAKADQFRQWQRAYPTHYTHPGCQTPAEQAALIDGAQAKQAAWFRARLDDLFPLSSDIPI
ncbi:MAG: glutamine amidotransferase [Pseudomonadota bacterium]